MDNSDKPPKPLNKEDQAQWDEFTGKNWDSAKEQSFQELLDANEISESDEKSTKRPIEPQKSEVIKTAISKQSSEIDRRTEEKIRKGKMPIDAKLDLHGMSQTQAYQALETFIKKSVEQQKRCLLVVTGKGKANSTSDDWITPGQGVLKQKVPEWLQTSTLKNSVLNFYPAMPKHGGTGALYIYLRRQR